MSVYSTDRSILMSHRQPRHDHKMLGSEEILMLIWDQIDAMRDAYGERVAYRAIRDGALAIGLDDVIEYKEAEMNGHLRTEY